MLISTERSRSQIELLDSQGLFAPNSLQHSPSICTLERHAARHFNSLSIHLTILVRKKRRNHRSDIVRRPARLGAGHFAKTIIREILRMAFFDSPQNEPCDELGLVTIGVTGRRPAARWIPHPVLAEVRRGDKRVDFADDDAVLFQLGACGKTKTKKRTLR